MSLDAEANDLKALLTAATGVPVEDLDELKARGSLPVRYAELYLAPRFGGEGRIGGRVTRLRRLSVRVAAKSISDARLIEQRISDAFELTPVAVDGRQVLVEYESGGGAFDYDDGGYYSALTDWIY